MSDFFSAAVALQAEIVRAQKAQLDAAQTMLDAGRQALAVQDDMRKAAEANLKAWRGWASLWGIK